MSQTALGASPSTTQVSQRPYAGHKLVVMICMHRSGSSVTTKLFSRLGMSLGPFELIGATDSNPHGHFEAVPFHALDRELQLLTQGFADDVPDTAETLQEFSCRAEPWRSGVAIPADAYRRGREMVQALVASGRVAGFKDPRALLLWPFWQEVWAAFPGLEIVPLFLTRSPHEIAMSIFARSKGRLAYQDALDVTAVHFRHMLKIRDNWPGPQAVIRFDPAVYAADVRHAAEVCGLTWDDAVFAEVYDAQCKHHDPAVVGHVAQELFERMSDASPGVCDAANLRRLETDAVRREAILQARLLELGAQVEQSQEESRELSVMLQQCGRELEELRLVNAQHVSTEEQLQNEAQQLLHVNQQYAQTLIQCGQEITNLRDTCAQYSSVERRLQAEFDRFRAENRQYATTLEQCGREIENLRQTNLQYASLEQQLQLEFDKLRAENRQYAATLEQCDREIGALRGNAAEHATRADALDRELKRLRELLAHREQQHDQKLGEAQTEIDLLHREVADCEMRLETYKQLHQQGQQQVATLRENNASCLFAIELLRRSSKSHQQLLAAYQRNLNHIACSGHEASAPVT